MEIGRGGIESSFDPERFACGERFLEFRAQLRFTDNFR
jgi:hypothetical protein